jgi:hypothetical protein
MVAAEMPVPTRGTASPSRKAVAVNWDALSAIGSIGQFVVVLVAAFLGIRQLVHLRRQSELEASIPLLSTARSEEHQAAYSLMVAANGGEDPDLVAAIANGDIADPRVRAVLTYAHLLNEIGLLVEEGLIQGTGIIPHYRGAIVMAWDLVTPYVAKQRRNASGSSFFVPLEALAVRARALTTEGRFSIARASLPRELRAAFDRSVNQTRLREPGPSQEPPPKPTE